ncbi:MAG: multicopper oxidase family protein, partial [Acidobacteriota bacterium]|nr:multicopper oxidase family protein [Acidobacteriota bacterium]
MTGAQSRSGWLPSLALLMVVLVEPLATQLREEPQSSRPALAVVGQQDPADQTQVVSGAEPESHAPMDDAAPNNSVVWRGPPMGRPMPMLPGLMGASPIVDPFLAGTGLNPLSLPEAIPGTIVDLVDGDEIDLTATLVRRTINGQTLVTYGYNGMYPGPLVRAPRGSTIVVNFTNEIPYDTTVHWHGIRIDNRFDGMPNLTQPPLATGESFRYEVFFRDSGIYWYHPHVREDFQQDLGLYGNLLVGAPEPEYYNPVNHEETLILDDFLMDDLGPIPFGQQTATHALMGRFGNVMLVNGLTDYRLEVAMGDVVRFYVTNVANTRTYNVVFGDAPIKIVGSDVSKFEREEWVGSVIIAPAERYIVEVKFDEPGEVPVTNAIQAIDEFRGEFYPHIDQLGIVAVSERPTIRDHAESFESLREHVDVTSDIDVYRPYFDRPVDHRLVLTLDIENLPLPIVRAMEFEAGLYMPPLEWNDAMPMMNWLSSAEQVHWILQDPDTGLENMDIDWQFTVGDVVKIRLFNDPNTIHPMHHPFHIHGQRFLVLSIDGIPTENLVWKDTAVVPVGSTVDYLVEMSNPGR